MAQNTGVEPAPQTDDAETATTGGGTGGRQNPLGSPSTVLLVVVVLVVGVIIILFSLTTPSTPAPQPAMPQLLGKGLQFAVAQARGDEWKHVETYDALGQDRDIGDQREWRVCYQSPPAGTKSGPRNVSLGAVQTKEPCPVQNYGELPQVYDSAARKGTNVVPNLYLYTPYMARRAFGDDASIRVLRRDRTSGGVSVQLFGDRNTSDDEVSGDQGDWLICRQSLAPGTSWDGQVLTTWVVPVDDGHC